MVPKTYCILTGPPFRMQAAFLSERAGLMGAGCLSSIAKVGFNMWGADFLPHRFLQLSHSSNKQDLLVWQVEPGIGSAK